MSFKKKLQYCTRCLMPETQEGVNFDELGIVLLVNLQKTRCILTG